MRRALGWVLGPSLGMAAALASGCDAKPNAGGGAVASAATSVATSVGDASTGAGGASAASSSAVSASELETNVQGRLPVLRRECYEPYLRKGGERLPKPLQLMLELNDDGSVRDVAAAGGAADQRTLRGCIEDAARHWRLPAPGKHLELAVSLPL